MKKRYNHLTNTGWLRHKTPKVCPLCNAFSEFFSSSGNPKSDNEKTQPSAISSGNSPSGGKIKTGINVFVAYIPGLL